MTAGIGENLLYLSGAYVLIGIAVLMTADTRNLPEVLFVVFLWPVVLVGRLFHGG